MESPYSGYDWVWLDEMGNQQLMGLKNKKRRLSLLRSELDVLI